MNYKKLVMVGVGLFTLLISMVNLTPFAGKANAVANNPYNWQSATVITDGSGVPYTYQKTVSGGAQSGGACGKSACPPTLLYEAIFVTSGANASCHPNHSDSKTNGNYTYHYSDIDDDGQSVIIIETGTTKYDTGAKAKNSIGTAVQIGFNNPSNPNISQYCQVDNFSTITIGNATSQDIHFNWVDENTIVGLDPSQKWTYKNTDPANPNNYYATASSSGQSGCFSYLAVTSDGTHAVNNAAQSSQKDSSYKQAANGCWYKNTDPSSGPYLLGNQQLKTAPGDPSDTGPTNCTQDANGNCTAGSDDSLNCGGGAFNYILCSGIEMLQDAADKLDNFITSELNVNTQPIFDVNNSDTDSADNAKAYMTAWNSFRILALALLVIAGLVMVASQALGFEFLDAYTIRKVLPRLLIAIIGISLSWPLLQFVINLFDVIGYDVRELIYAPFNAMAQGGGTTAIKLLGNPLTLITATGALFIIYGPAVFTFLITAFLALMVAFLVLIIRQIAVVMLVIVAPLAIACYVLPNTHKAWKLWVDNFMGVMLMFPIISAMIAAGHVMSAIGRTGSTFQQFVAIIAYFVPYFMLPFAFRLATGAISTIAGLVNDRSKGAFDRLKKYRGEKASENMHKVKTGERFSDRNKFTRGFNRASGDLGSGWAGGFGMGARGEQHRDQRARIAAANKLKDPRFTAIAENDEAQRAATYDSAAEARKGLYDRHRALNLEKGQSVADAERNARDTANNAVAAVQSSIGFSRSSAIAASQQLATTGTGYKDLDDQARTIARAAGGNQSSIDAIAGYNNFINKQKGRHDLAPGAGATATAAKAAQSAGNPHEAFTTLTDAEVNALPAQEKAKYNARKTYEDTISGQKEAAWSSGSLYQLANGKTAATKNMAEYWVDEYNSAVDTGDPTKLAKAQVALLEMKAMFSNASGDNRTVLGNAVDRMEAKREDKSRAEGFAQEVTVTDPNTGAKTRQWQDRSGNVVPDRPATQKMYEQAEAVARRNARVYERPDPNNIQP